MTNWQKMGSHHIIQLHIRKDNPTMEKYTETGLTSHMQKIKMLKWNA